MALERMTFLGASVIDINTSVGFGGEESKMDITVVEDIRNGDAFIAPPIGAPVYFQYNEFYFGGLLQNVAYGESPSGKTYQCTVIDPRSLLNGVQVILSEYTGTVNDLANIMNVYGYFEAFGFGQSESNSSGMKWNKIRDGLIAMSNFDIDGGYGGPISYKGYIYFLDATSLPILPTEYRLNGNMSLMDIIQNVCDAAALDFFFELRNVGITNYIILRTISRAYVPVRGVISQFITQTQGAIAKSVGENMVNETCGKFCVGAKKRDMYFQFTNGPRHQFFMTTRNTGVDFQINGPVDGFNNTIWPFWGHTLGGNVVVGQGLDDDHVFTLDSRKVMIPGIGESYPTSLGEIRAALSSIEDWQSYLTIHNDIEFLMNEHGEFTAEFPTVGKKTSGILKYQTNRVPNPHFGKATRLGLFSGITGDVIALLADIINVSKGAIPSSQMIEIIPGKKENALEKLYKYIKDYASEFYGLKFMVAVPGIQAARESNSEVIRTNVVPVDGAYITDSTIADGINNNLIPVDINQITNYENGLIRAFVRFDNIGELDFSDVPDDSLFWSADRSSIFVECVVDTDIIYLGNNYTNPRVVITLPGRVVLQKPDDIDLAFTAQLLRNLFVANWEENNNVTKDKKKDDAKKPSRAPSMTFMFEDANCVEAAMPSVAAIPLESNVSRYGPWVAIGAIGAMEYEEDDTLCPWNYGGFTNMNLAGNAKVSSAIGNLQYIESGSVEFPGLPNVSLGDRLMSVGPYISGIQVKLAPDGATTTYRMETWKIKFGAFPKLFQEKLAKAEQDNIQLKRNFNESLKINKKRNSRGRWVG